MGLPPEAAMRSCLLATGLARRMNLTEQEVSDVYYTTLLQHVGCTAFAHETAALFGGDDIALRAAGARVDFANQREAASFLLFGIAKGTTPMVRTRSVITAWRMGSTFDEALSRSNCDVAVQMARRLGMGDDIHRGLTDIHERWDGRGNPRRLARDDIAVPARFAQVAGQAMQFHLIGGIELATGVVRRRAGSALEPSIAATLLGHGPELLAEIDAMDPAVAVIGAEPEPHRSIPESGLDDLAAAFGDMADLKSPSMHGHSAAVAHLAHAAANNLGFPEPERVRIRRAGNLHDLGRVGVPSGIWDKPGPLTTAEWERVRLHPYHSERILLRSPVLAPLGQIAGMHHERLDGSGYHRQARSLAIPHDARLLAAADAYQAMTQDRAHRPARTPGEAALELSKDADQGRLDGESVRAILEVAGHAPFHSRGGWPAGLTDREVQVLRLAARGLSNREIGSSLFISPKTADHHIQHIYSKIGVSTRAGAAMYAMEHDLVHERTPGQIG